MALQGYRERVLYPSVTIQATFREIGLLVMGLDVELELERKTVLDDGLVIYRNLNKYRIVGNSDEIVCDTLFDEDMPLDLSRFIRRMNKLQITMTLEKP